MKKSHAIVIASLSLIFAGTVIPAATGEVTATRHIVEGVFFSADTAATPVWDMAGAMETATYPVRLRADADSVFDITSRGQRLDFRLTDDGIRLRSMENGRMRLADSIGLLFAHVPLGPGSEAVDTSRIFRSVGFSSPHLPTNLTVKSWASARGLMIFPDGDTIPVARLDLEFMHDGGTRQLSYWFADSVLLPVARQSVATDTLGFRNETFCYTYPSEMDDVAAESRKFLNLTETGIYAPSLFTPAPSATGGNGSPGCTRRFSDDNPGGDTTQGADGPAIDIALESAAPGETYTYIIADAKGIVWRSGDGTAGFNSARVQTGALPTGLYLITVTTASGKTTTVRHYHEAR